MHATSRTFPSFEINSADAALVGEVIQRAIKLGLVKRRSQTERLSLNMDLTATNANGCPLDFAALLRFEDFSFTHDIQGIRAHMDRETGKLLDCFRPRCSR